MSIKLIKFAPSVSSQSCASTMIYNFENEIPDLIYNYKSMWKCHLKRQPYNIIHARKKRKKFYKRKRNW